MSRRFWEFSENREVFVRVSICPTEGLCFCIDIRSLYDILQQSLWNVVCQKHKTRDMGERDGTALMQSEVDRSQLACLRKGV